MKKKELQRALETSKSNCDWLRRDLYLARDEIKKLHATISTLKSESYGAQLFAALRRLAEFVNVNRTWDRTPGALPDAVANWIEQAIMSDWTMLANVLGCQVHVSTICDEVKKLKKRATNDGAAQLEIVIEARDDEIQTLRDHVTELETEIASLRRDREDQTARATGYQDQIETLKGQKQTANERVAELEAYTETLAETIKKACDPVQSYVMKYNIGRAGDNVHEIIVTDAERLRRDAEYLTSRYATLTTDRDKLWQLLDHIDTLDDSCRGDDVRFRRLTRSYQKQRWDIWNPTEKRGGGAHGSGRRLRSTSGCEVTTPADSTSARRALTLTSAEDATLQAVLRFRSEEDSFGRTWLRQCTTTLQEERKLSALTTVEDNALRAALQLDEARRRDGGGHFTAACLNWLRQCADALKEEREKNGP